MAWLKRTSTLSSYSPKDISGPPLNVLLDVLSPADYQMMTMDNMDISIENSAHLCQNGFSLNKYILDFNHQDHDEETFILLLGNK